MAQSVFVSFDYDKDFWRVQQVLQMGAIENEPLLTAQRWEEVKRKGDAAIKNWIDTQMARKPVVLVLVGEKTASSRWVDYEIRTAWDSGKRLVGVRINGLKDSFQNTSPAGANPFASVGLKNGRSLDEYVPLITPNGYTSQAIHSDIKINLPSWLTRAVKMS